MSDTTNPEAKRHWPEDSSPTPQQWVNRFLDADDDRRLKMAERVIANAEAAYQCFIQDHEGERAYTEALAEAAGSEKSETPR